ncbi:hypothetical protein B0I27_1115 [Arcticibacter pallidicorallinus]|uniref:Uncharacterized protein n=1 Tax=Arcticibacter pallidicorallinus TaxID=1259464 RepID=A0A2T0TUW4_9SPHI|nr:hypothetical protein B0I27_1115 [Arcticibacter pallidicorallinus]
MKWNSIYADGEIIKRSHVLRTQSNNDWAKLNTFGYRGYLNA